MTKLKKSKFLSVFLTSLLLLQSLTLLVLVGAVISKYLGKDHFFHYSIGKKEITAAQHGIISLEFTGDHFNLQVDSNELIKYKLSYQTEDKIETIKEEGQGDPRFEKMIYAGSCSRNDCTPHQNINVGVLKIQIGDDQINSLSFNLQNDEIDFVHFQSSSNFDLSDQDQNFLEQKLIMDNDERATYLNPLAALYPYRSPFNNKFWLNFHKLPNETQSISLQAQNLSSNLITEINAFSDQAFFIDTDMNNQDYIYDLTLPLPDNYQNEELIIRRSDSIDGPFQELNVQYEIDGELVIIKDVQQDGVFVITRTGSAIVENPLLDDTCGLDMVLVLDTSGSIDNNELQKMKQAFHSFVDAFIPATPTQIAVIEFDTAAKLIQDFSNDATVIKNAIDQGSSGGWTNWQDALDIASSLNFPRTSKANLVIFSSDGHPTRPLHQNYTQENLELAKESANQLKQNGTRIMSLGIGNDLSVDNLKIISGPKVDSGDINTDIITTNFDQLANDLSAFAQQLCGGKILIQKQLDMNKNGDLEDLVDLKGTNESEYLADWEFSLTGSQQATQSTDSSGSLEFEVDPGTYSLVEILKNNYEQQNFSCQKKQENIGEPITLGINNLKIGQEETISCHVINEPLVAWSNETVLFLEKSNNRETEKLVAGDDVIYTLKINSPNQPVADVQVTDLMPEGFNYRPGSWKAESNYRGNLKEQNITPEPNYQSPGIWSLGDLDVGEEVTLTLIADISQNQEPGTYPDLAIAEGESEQGEVVYANDGTYFVGTEVEIIAQEQANETLDIEKYIDKEKNKSKNEPNKEAESTETKSKEQPVLPKTGLSAIWLSLSVSLVISGSGFLTAAWLVYQQTKHKLDIKEHKINEKK